ncbi:MAG: aldehyde dehydrogenase family protein [Solirubrobacteraceae bacterium]
MFRSVDPASGEEIAHYQQTDADGVDRVLDRATTRFGDWGALSPRDRADRLRPLAYRLRASSSRLADLIVRETGKPVRQARAEIDKSAATVDWFVANGPDLLDAQPIDTGATVSEVRYEPLGPVLAIMPWNYPVWQLIRAAIPALLSGNPVVFKPAPNTVGCAFATVAVFDDALVQILLTDNDLTSSAIADDRIAAVTLTGSVRAGRAVGALAGENLKKAVLELGGSDPFVVLSDADVDRAADAACWARMQNNGQACIAAKRFIVAEPVADDFLAAFAERVGSLVLGDPQDEHTDVGPVARADVRDELQRQLESSVTQGATLVTGAGSLDREGWWFEPTIVTGAVPGMPVWDEETFGPLAAVHVAGDDAAAIAAAHHPRFGLGVSLWTADEDAAFESAGDFDAGMVFVNSVVTSDPRLPFGGVRESGLGRELGAQGLREFTNIKSVVVGACTRPDQNATLRLVS